MEIIDAIFSEVEKNLAEQHWEALDVLHEAVRTRFTELYNCEKYIGHIVPMALLFIELIEKEEMNPEDRAAMLALKKAILATFTFEKAA